MEARNHLKKYLRNMDTLNIEKLEINYDEDYSNFRFLGIGKPSKGQIKRQAKRTVGRCVQPAVPENPLNRKKWNQYRDCLKVQMQEEKAKREKEIELAKAEERARVQAEMEAKKLSERQSYDTGSKSINEDDGKILGMPKGLAIGLGVAVLAIGGFVAYKIIKSKK